METQKNSTTKEQIDVLKYLISTSKDAGEETKKACLALINASQGLSIPVYFTGHSKDISFGVHNMVSAHGTTHLNEIMRLMNTKWRFSHHGGYFEKITKSFIVQMSNGHKYTHTIWLSPVRYDEKAIGINRDQVDAIVLKDGVI